MMLVVPRLLGGRSGKRAVAGHIEIQRRFFGAFGRGVREFPFAGQVAFGRILWLFRFMDRRIFRPSTKTYFDFRLFVKKIAIGDDEIGDLAGLDGAEAIGHAENLRGRQRQRAQRGIGRKPCIDRFLRRLQDVFRSGDSAGVKRERNAGFGKRCG